MDIRNAEKSYQASKAAYERARDEREDAALRDFNRRTTLREIADRIGVTVGRVSQMVEAARQRQASA